MIQIDIKEKLFISYLIYYTAIIDKLQDIAN